MIPLSLPLADVVLPEGLMWVSRSSLLCWGVGAWPVLLTHRPYIDRRTMVRVHRSILLHWLAQKSLFMQAAPGLAWQAVATIGTSITTMTPCLPFIPWHQIWYIAAHILCWICLTELKLLLHLLNTILLYGKSSLDILLNVFHIIKKAILVLKRHEGGKSFIFGWDDLIWLLV